MTHTRTHVVTAYANPHLVCSLCREPATGFHRREVCGCEQDAAWLSPCMHAAEVMDLCPSWSPVDGCQCLGVLGAVDHPPARQP